MRILSIDPGFERMGVAILEYEKGSNKPLVIYSTCVVTSRKDGFEKRLMKLGDTLRWIIKEHKPTVLAIERLFFSTNQKTALSVAEARGVAVYEAARNNLTLNEYTPIQIKAAVAGYGRATKEQVISMIYNLVDFKDEEKNIKIATSTTRRDGGKAKPKKVSDDEFDAIAVGVTHLAHNNLSIR